MKKSWLLRTLLFCTVIFFMVSCCQENSDCPPDSYCIKAPGDCEGEGVCIEKKSVPCDVVTEPVCGCDGKIYDNVCEAAEAGVSVTDKGECNEGCKGNDNCEEGYYCEKAEGDCEGEGTCTEIETACTGVIDPVCGCDGETYANACLAGAAGVNVAYEGECVDVCSGNDDCEEGYYCEKAEGDCDGTDQPDPPVDPPDEGGILEWCTRELCVASETLRDECVDTMTTCIAAAETQIDLEECVALGLLICSEVGGELGATGNYTREISEGTCTEIETACTGVIDPVCGCDGETYANDCLAGAAGVNVAYEGECKVNEPPDCNEAYADLDELWPPNHKYVGIEIMGVTDPNDDLITIAVTAITQDEEVDAKGGGDGNTAPDGMGIGTNTASVRAERQGKGNGRVYEISFTATDSVGEECTGAVQVCVPHDQRPRHECINDGQNYDSTIE